MNDSITVRINPDGTQVAILAPGSTVVLEGVETVRDVRDQLTAHLLTMGPQVAFGPDPGDPGPSVDPAEDYPEPGPADVWPKHGWHSEPIPGRGGGINV